VRMGGTERRPEAPNTAEIVAIVVAGREGPALSSHSEVQGRASNGKVLCTT